MVDQHIQQIMQEQRIPGLAVAILQNNDLQLEHYSGFASLEHNVPVTSQTIFEIASVTKLFTAQAILLLAQEKQIELAAPIASCLDDLPATWNDITIQHCLTHQSGIPSYTEVDAYWQMTRKDKTHEELLALVRDLLLKFVPGTRNAYDNTAFYLLGLIIEAVSGMSYEAFLWEKIFTPLQMNATQANNYVKVIPHRCQGYIYKDGDFSNKDFYSISNTFSAGILLSTLPDMIQWQAALFNARILNEELRQKWWTPYPSQEGNEHQYGYTMGLGWFLVESAIGAFWGHNGSITGFAAAFLHFPKTKISAVVLCNAGHVAAPHQIAIDLIQQLNLSSG